MDLKVFDGKVLGCFYIWKCKSKINKLYLNYLEIYRVGGGGIWIFFNRFLNESFYF